MRTKEFDWLDTSTMTPKYGVMGFVKGKWMALYDKEKCMPVLFDTELERDAERKVLRKQKTIE